MLVRFRFRLLAFTVLVLGLRALAAEEKPLRQLIDEQLRLAWEREKLTPAKRSSDSEFLRRVTLDLIGTAPSYEETVEFLASTDPKKREKWIDRLLDSPQFAQAQANVWDLVLFGRHPGYPDATRNRSGFKAWLAQQFKEKVPLDRWVAELLKAEQPGSELFYVQFRNQPEEATVAVARIFLGTQLQCARCHDHPFDRWTQKDFYGMTGFFVRLAVEESGAGNTKKFSIGEKASGEVLFTGSAKEQTPGKKGEPIKPRFLGGPDLDEPPAPKETKEKVKEGAKLPKPPFSRKEKLAAWVTSSENPYLARAVVNRVWGQFMGNGIVHPVDDFNAESKPSHPELLQTLTESFRKSGYQIRDLIREIVNSEAYQLSQAGEGTVAMPKWYERARVRPLSAEEIVSTMRKVTGYDLGTKPDEKLPNSGDEYFLRFFGEPTNGLGDFQGSLQEHLFLNNAEQVRALIRRRKGNLVDTLLTSSDAIEKKIERLYLTVLQRKPKESETELFRNYLSKKEKPEPLMEDCVWALLNGSEFRFNH
jgi:hypothetical protein